jgi:DNA-directed RNA polymerase subunit beta'
VLKTLGVSDDELEKSWGKDILHSNKNARAVGTAIERFYKTDTKKTAPSREAAAEHLYNTLTSATLRPEVTAVTLGKPLDRVNGEVLHLTTQKLLRVQAGHPEDDRDSLLFKDLRSMGDFAADKLRNAGRVIKQKADRKINMTTDLRDVVKFDIFNQPIKEIFRTSLARTASQINPAEMVAASMQTTIMGPGGIQSEQAITEAAKMINPSHFGYLDPINTPEGDKTGVSLRLPLGVKKRGHEPFLPLYNLKTGKMEDVPPSRFLAARVVLPDQVRWDGGKPTPISKNVKIMGEHNKVEQTAFDDAHYVMRHPSQLFNMTSNLIPFMGSNSGGRAGMATRHIEQSISLLHREAPLVQVSTGVEKQGVNSFESLLGKQSAHFAPVDGTIHDIKHDAIIVKDSAGKTHEVQMYNHYPLNEAKGVLHSTPVVKVGDSVKNGQVIADTNFSRNGTLALGTNLRVAYIPFKGYNFEDGIVISESAARKLTSQHLHKPTLQVDDKTVFNLKKFQIEHPGAFSKEQIAKVGEDGIVKPGTKVRPGDPLIVAMKPFDLKDRTGVAAIRRSLSGSHTDKSLRWESDFEGEVVGVHKVGNFVKVHVRTSEPMQVGDKMAGRYGNKGIVTMVLPDHEMPKTSNGKHIEVALNPSGVPGRMNVGQVLETAAAKIAEKTGKPYIVNNFDPNTPDYLEKIKKELKQHGLSDTEELFDPKTGQSLGHALVGPKHMLKLVHQVEKKVAVRSGMGLPGIHATEGYDINLMPASGGHSGGQTIGALGLYAMLAHGAKANIREMQTYKSEGPDPQTNAAKAWPSLHNQVWNAIQTGNPLPPPKATFAFQKFTDMLRASGVNVEKSGHEMILSPMTDRHILSMSSGELAQAGKIVRAKLEKDGMPKPMPGGLFDEKITGGHGGNKWSHIRLAEPLPNPVFEGPIRTLTGLKEKEFDSVLHGEKGVSTNGQLVEPKNGVTGGHGIKLLLQQIDVDKTLATRQKDLQKATDGPKVDKLLKEVKYLKALKQLNLKPHEAYMLHHLPVLPPVMRPLTVLADGNIKYEDVNGLYSQLAQINDKLKDPVLSKNLTDAKKKTLRVDFYDGVKAIMGAGLPYDARKEKGLLHQVHGSSPKEGYFQSVLTSRRQDLTMRSTIVPEPNLGLDEVGIPRESALTLFRPFVVRQLHQMGGAPTPLDAQKAIAEVHKGKNNPMVWKALEKVMEERPVLMKRDPVLHKYGIQAFKPRITEGNAIRIHPLVTGGFNADFDGDTMSVYVPISHEAVAEARKMFPSSNLFSEASGKVMYQPTLESALGLYKLSQTGKQTDHKFKDHGEAVDALKRGKVHFSDVVNIEGKKTTAGRVMLANILPDAMKSKVLHNLDYQIDKKGLDTLLTDLAKNHRHDYGTVVNKLKDIGNNAAFGVVHTDLHPEKVVPIGTHTLSLKDFETDKASRDHHITAAQTKVDGINASTTIPKGDKDRRVIDIWTDTEKKIHEAHKAKMADNPTNLSLMWKAGVKPSWDQYKQMTLAPMLLKDSTNKTIPVPVTKSYAEGLDVAGYWTQTHGARRGAVMKVQEVREPGYMSKLLMNSSMNLLVDTHDCGTSKGVSLHIEEKDVHDRHLAQDLKVGNLHLSAGTVLSPDVVGKIRATDKNAHVVVRSPLKCEHEKGICQKCLGLSPNGKHYDLGTNAGVLAAQAVGERAVQLPMKEFHTGGVASGGGKVVNQFQRFQDLTMLPQKIANSATLSLVSGKIDKIEHDPTGVRIHVGGHVHHVAKDANGMHLHEDLPGATKRPDWVTWKSPTVGMHVDAGQHLSDPNRTVINPHDLYRATGSIEKVQNHMTNEMYDLYKEEGVLRRNIETVVKAMSNLTKIEHPGDHDHVLRGEFHPTSVIKKINETQLKGKNPIVHTPVLKGLDMLPMELHEDWMAKLQHQRLTSTIMDAAAKGLRSNLHGAHPIPGVAFGAEFGITSEKAKQPGFERFKNVPGHHY